LFYYSYMKIYAIGHRGASGHAPENTLESHRMAIRMGVDFVEMDIHMLRDGTLVTIHDADLKRTTNGKGWVGDLTLAELKRLDAGSWFNTAYPEKARPEFSGAKVPTLQEVIDLVKPDSAGLFVEIKDPERYSPDLESSLLSLIRHNRMEQRTRFISFSARSLLKIKKLDDSARTVLLIAKPEKDPVDAAAEISADELGLLYLCATPETVENAHRRGMSINVWTVDRQEDMQRMIGLGVDRITSNYPDRLIDLLPKA
jgi:glycerophosphoryl diester phosphodiesterase